MRVSEQKARQSSAGLYEGSSRRSKVALSLRREEPCRFHVEQRMQNAMCECVFRSSRPGKATLGCIKAHLDGARRLLWASLRPRRVGRRLRPCSETSLRVTTPTFVNQPKRFTFLTSTFQRNADRNQLSCPFSTKVALSLRREEPCRFRIQQRTQR